MGIAKVEMVAGGIRVGGIPRAGAEMKNSNFLAWSRKL